MHRSTRRDRTRRTSGDAPSSSPSPGWKAYSLPPPDLEALSRAADAYRSASEVRFSELRATIGHGDAIFKKLARVWNNTVAVHADLDIPLGKWQEIEAKADAARPPSSFCRRNR